MSIEANSFIHSIRSALSNFYAKAASIDPAELALKCTLVMILFSKWITGADWFYITPLLMLSAIGLMIPTYHKNKFLWYAITAVMVFKTLDQWWIQDNHLFVLTYWCIAISIGFALDDLKGVLKLNARLLLGFAFALAILWKVFLSPDYINGDYFYFTFLTDMRFAEEAAMLANFPQSAINENIVALNNASLANPGDIQLKTNEALPIATFIVTLWTTLIETLIAITFLWPAKSSRFQLIHRCRNWSLIIFSWTTYLAAPVITFGWTLNAIAIAQTSEDEKLDRFMLFLTLPMLLLYKHVPVMSWISNTVSAVLY